MELGSEVLCSVGRVEKEVCELCFPAYKLLLHLLSPLAHFVEVLFFDRFPLLPNLGKFDGKTCLRFVDIYFPCLGLVVYPSS